LQKRRFLQKPISANYAEFLQKTISAKTPIFAKTDFCKNGKFHKNANFCKTPIFAKFDFCKNASFCKNVDLAKMPIFCKNVDFCKRLCRNPIGFLQKPCFSTQKPIFAKNFFENIFAMSTALSSWGEGFESAFREIGNLWNFLM
jgi:hypothetical protein